MTLPRLLVIASMLCLCLTTSSEASLVWLNFAGWNHNQITSGGQTFTDIFGDLDVQVTSTGSHPVNSAFSGSGNWISTANNTAANQFMFTFSKPINVAVEVRTLDSQEEMTITTGGTKTYSHIFGALPTLTGNLKLTGNGTGINPTGATRGIVNSTSTTSLIVDYNALHNNKFEFFRIGTNDNPTVPEPSSGVIFALGSLGLLRARRRK